MAFELFFTIFLRLNNVACRSSIYVNTNVAIFSHLHYKNRDS